MVLVQVIGGREDRESLELELQIVAKDPTKDNRLFLLLF